MFIDLSVEEKQVEQVERKERKREGSPSFCGGKNE